VKFAFQSLTGFQLTGSNDVAADVVTNQVRPGVGDMEAIKARVSVAVFLNERNVGDAAIRPRKLFLIMLYVN
jgi:hypothetical protein